MACDLEGAEDLTANFIPVAGARSSLKYLPIGFNPGAFTTMTVSGVRVKEPSVTSTFQGRGTMEICSARQKLLRKEIPIMLHKMMPRTIALLVFMG
jgi:hypothetical protein